MRKIEFANEEIYHIFNRGVEKRKIFLNDPDYFRFLDSIKEFNNSLPAWKAHDLSSRGEASTDSYIEIIAYCINPNHFHLIMKQLKKDGISLFMHKLGTGYSMYFNNKHKHSGVVFQGVFKAKHIDTNEYLLHLSAYVNCNSEVHGICKAENYKWCSFPDYIKKRPGNLLGKSLNKGIVIDQFRSVKEYEKFAKIKAREMKRRKDEDEMDV
jgi:putative transposase